MSSIASSAQPSVPNPSMSYNLLILGPTLTGLKKKLADSNSNFQAEFTKSLNSFHRNNTKSKQSQNYECLVINLIDAVDATYLKLVSILASNMGKRIIVLAPKERIELVKSLPSVEQVFATPVSNDELMGKLEQLAQEEGSDQTAEEEPPAQKKGVTAGFEASIAAVKEADQTVWRKFLPIVNFVYKKAAIAILTALFVTFLCYGVMIIFFLSSTNWTLPFSLSAGNKLVEKVEQDISQLQFSQNSLRQNLAANTTKITIAQRKKRESELLIDGLSKTIKNEIYTQKREQAKLHLQADRLKNVELEIARSRKETSLDEYYSDLQKAYKNKIVSRRLIEGVRLSILEAQHLLATIRNDINDKTERANLAQRREFGLKKLLSDIKKPVLTSAPDMGSQFAHFANELVVAHTSHVSAESEFAASLKSRYQIQNSLKLVTKNIERLEKTPLARAMTSPVAVLFIPYQNDQGAKEGDPLFGCSFFIFFCQEVGKLGARVDGETTASHPMFEKPMRGYFVEAKFDNQTTVTQDMIHIGSKPFLF